MHHPAPGPKGPWRLLILDRNPDDPLWIVATVAGPDDVRPAAPEAGSHRNSSATVDDVTAAWVAAVAGLRHPALTPLPATLAWRVDDGVQR